MNITAAIELAFATILRQFATLGERVVVRPWQALSTDPSWSQTKDRSFPMVSIQCAAPATEDGNPAVMQAVCKIICGTWNDEDQSHAKISAMFSESYRVLAELFGAFRKADETNEVYALFKAELEREADSATFADWALKWQGGDAPLSGEGANFIGLSIVVTYRNPAFC